MSSRPHHKNTQPKTYKVSPRSLLSLPFRLCNPPPAVGKIRSCGVTPLLQVRLEDVLERRHLPPLGLKDFEEWLLFVEMSPENLYFTLWLREYKQRYNQWKSQTAFQSKNAPPNFPLNWSQQYSSHLAMFYARAKQTFFTPGSEYELNLTSSLLAPFHEANMPHPDPELFREVELETWRTLEASLRRFVLGQLNNVGNARVLCGMVAGTVFCLLGCIAPLVMNFMHGESRWTRLVALPGLWFGLTVLFASLNGMCLGIYIFGDLRQLRKFELSRPPISKPQPLPQTFRRMSLGASPQPASNAILPGQMGAPLNRVPTTSSADSRTSDASSSNTVSTDDNIHISPAYYDADDDATDMDIWSPAPDVGGANKENDAHMGVAPDLYTATATFIHAFDVPTDDEDELVRALQLPARHQPMSPFDFDALPAHPHPPNHRARARPHLPPLATGPAALLSPASQLQLRDAIAAHAPRPPEPVAPATFLLRMQAKCNFKSWRLQTGFLEEAGSSPSSPAPHPSSPYWAARASTPMTATTLARPSSGSEKTVLGSGSDVGVDGDVEKKVRRRFRMAKAVPAFRVPLARVLSPVVVRGQWEIVIRAALGALLLAWIVIAMLLAVPPIPRRGSS